MSPTGTEDDNYAVMRELIESLRTEISNLNLRHMEMTAEIEQFAAALKPFAELADRKEYTLDDVPHGLMIDAKLALRGMRVVNGLVEQSMTNSVIPCPNPKGCNWPACPLDCQWRPGRDVERHF